MQDSLLHLPPLVLVAGRAQRHPAMGSAKHDK